MMIQFVPLYSNMTYIQFFSSDAGRVKIKKSPVQASEHSSHRRTKRSSSIFIKAVYS